MDVALLPIGGVFTMDVDEAVKASLAIQPKLVIPMHNRGVDPEKFQEEVESRSDIIVCNLHIGEDFIYNL